MRWTLAGLATAAVILAVAAAASGSTVATSASVKPLTVLFVGDMSGATKALGADEYSGIEAAAYYLNHHGGLDGHPVTIAKIDDGGNPQTAVSSTLQYLSSHPRPVAVWPGAESGVNSAMIPLIKTEKLLALAISDGNGACATKAQTVCPTYFSLFPPATSQNNVEVQALKAKGVKKVGILEEAVPFTQGETPGFQAAFKADGISTTVVSFPATTLDLTPEMSQLQGQGVTAVLAETLGTASAYTLDARAKLGWSVPVYFDGAGSSGDVTKLVASSSEITSVYANIWTHPDNGCVNNKAVTALTATTTAQHLSIGTLVPLHVGGTAWAAMFLLDDVMKAAHGATTTTALANVLNRLPKSVSADPLTHTMSNRTLYTSSDHENLGMTSRDFQIVPDGPYSGGQLHPGC